MGESETVLAFTFLLTNTLLQHLKVKLNITQPSTKIKLHVPQKRSTPPAPSPPTPAPILKTESPIIPSQMLPQQPKQVRQGSPLKNQIITSPSKSPPSLRPAPPKAIPPTAPQKDSSVPPTDWPRPQQSTPILPTTNRTLPIQALPRPAPQPSVPSRTAVVPPAENGVRQPLHNLLLNTKKERNLSLIPLITISTLTAATSPILSTDSASSSPLPKSPELLLSITSTPPPAPSTQSLCLTVPNEISELVLNVFLTKDLTLHGSYTFTVSSNGRKIAPTIWPDASRRSGATDSITITPKGTPPGQTHPFAVGAIGDAWQFLLTLGEPGSITTIEASCTAFLKRDERGLLVRGERSRTGQAAGEDGGELERVVVLVLRGR